LTWPQIFDTFCGLKNLIQAGVEELSAIDGIGPARRSVKSRSGNRQAGGLPSESEKPVIKGPEDAA
jgi:DNA repair protein RadC